MCQRSFKNEITKWIKIKARIMRCHYQTKTSDVQNSSKANESLRESRPREKQNFSPRATKGQLISEWSFGVFKFPKKPTKFLSDFCPMKLGHKFVKKLVDFLGDLKAQKVHSEIKWPLVMILM